MEKPAPGNIETEKKIKYILNKTAQEQQLKDSRSKGDAILILAPVLWVQRAKRNEKKAVHRNIDKNVSAKHNISFSLSAENEHKILFALQTTHRECAV